MQVRLKPSLQSSKPLSRLQAVTPPRSRPSSRLLHKPRLAKGLSSWRLRWHKQGRANSGDAAVAVIVEAAVKAAPTQAAAVVTAAIQEGNQSSGSVASIVKAAATAAPTQAAAIVTAAIGEGNKSSDSVSNIVKAAAAAAPAQASVIVTAAIAETGQAPASVGAIVQAAAEAAWCGCATALGFWAPAPTAPPRETA